MLYVLEKCLVGIELEFCIKFYLEFMEIFIVIFSRNDFVFINGVNFEYVENLLNRL